MVLENDKASAVLIKLNTEYKTSFIRPLDYKYNEDTTISLNVNYDESVMVLGESPIYDLTDFEGILSLNGIDFQSQGFVALTDNETAKRVFELLNPEKRPAENLESFLKKWNLNENK